MTAYDSGQIEPRIEPLVMAIRNCGFVTFSSCEGHKDYAADPFRFASVVFFADEDHARKVHEAIVARAGRLRCYWKLRGGFVRHRENIAQWALGWILENCGAIDDANDEKDFVDHTVEAAWNHDIPLLVETFSALREQLSESC